MTTNGFDGIATNTLENECDRAEISLKKKAQEIEWLKMWRAIPLLQSEWIAFDAALFVANAEYQNTLKYLYAVEDALMERGAKGWVST